MTSSTSSLLGVYKQPDMVLTRGAGCRVWDESGREYLDFTSGIAVNALGHASPLVAAAIQSALDAGLVHTSNLYATRPGRELADLLVERSFPGRVFFCNSGGEANEAALKFARRWAGQGEGGKHEFLAFKGSFHGRLFGSLAVTDRPAYRAPFEPLMPGAHFAEVGDLRAVRSVLEGGTVAAVIIEVVQGEGGVRPVPPPFLTELRALCNEHGALLVFDEVQCGLGRTGTLFAWEQAGVTPDLMTLAKPLGGGLPMGAVVLGDHVAEAIQPGDHATTFGGGPLVASVALAVLRELAQQDFLDRVSALGSYLTAGLTRIAAGREDIVGARGLGLLQGLVLAEPTAADVTARARDLGLLVVPAGPDVVRVLPPLNVTEAELDLGLGLLEEAVG